MSSSSAAAATEMAVDTTVEGPVLKLKLQGMNDMIVDFPTVFLKYSKTISNIVEDLLGGNLDELVENETPIDIGGRINKDYYDIFIKYCTWMHSNPEIIAKRYKEVEKVTAEKDGTEHKETVTEFDKEFDLNDWELELFYELNDRFGTDQYQITQWEREWFDTLGQQIAVTKPDPEKGIKGGKEYKEYIDDPYQSVFTSFFYCTEFFECHILDQASKKFFAQKILPRWTPKELKTLGKEKFDSMNFKERYSEYDSNRDKINFDNLDELDRMALPKRNSKELAYLMGREWHKNPHATEDPVEYLNDPLQIFTLECNGPEKCYASECDNYNGAKPSNSNNNDNDDDDDDE